MGGLSEIIYIYVYIYTYICVYIYKYLTYDDNEHVLLLSPMAFLVLTQTFNFLSSDIHVFLAPISNFMQVALFLDSYCPAIADSALLRSLAFGKS